MLPAASSAEIFTECFPSARELAGTENCRDKAQPPSMHSCLAGASAWTPSTYSIDSTTPVSASPAEIATLVFSDGIHWPEDSKSGPLMLRAGLEVSFGRLRAIVLVPS